jgi:gamma-glutamylcyclotransferase (GGCT)/AIG2-like uncharacterized protein YtfP
MSEDPVLCRLFIYGTLLPGQCRWSLIEDLGGQIVGPAVTTGWLLDLGEYPGLVGENWLRSMGLLAASDRCPPSPSGTTGNLEPVDRGGVRDRCPAHGFAGCGVVHGLCVQFGQISRALAVLDLEEDCHTADEGWDAFGQPLTAPTRLGDGLYVRRLQKISQLDGSEIWAWAYHYNARVDSLHWIASGNWLAR